MSVRRVIHPIDRHLNRDLPRGVPRRRAAQEGRVHKPRPHDGAAEPAVQVVGGDEVGATDANVGAARPRAAGRHCEAVHDHCRFVAKVDAPGAGGGHVERRNGLLREPADAVVADLDRHHARALGHGRDAFDAVRRKPPCSDDAIHRRTRRPRQRIIIPRPRHEPALEVDGVDKVGAGDGDARPAARGAARGANAEDLGDLDVGEMHGLLVPVSVPAVRRG